MSEVPPPFHGLSLDCRGMKCPRPIIEVARRIGEVRVGALLSCWPTTRPPVPTLPPGVGCVGKPLSRPIRHGSSYDATREQQTPRPTGREFEGFRSVEAVAAGARTGRVGVVDSEALLLDRVDEVDGCAHEVRRAHPVGNDIHTAEGLDDVAFEAAIVEEQLVTQTRATARLHSHAERKVLRDLHLAGAT